MARQQNSDGKGSPKIPGTPEEQRAVKAAAKARRRPSSKSASKPESDTLNEQDMTPFTLFPQQRSNEFRWNPTAGPMAQAAAEKRRRDERAMRRRLELESQSVEARAHEWVTSLAEGSRARTYAEGILLCFPLASPAENEKQTEAAIKLTKGVLSELGFTLSKNDLVVGERVAHRALKDAFEVLHPQHRRVDRELVGAGV